MSLDRIEARHTTSPLNPILSERDPHGKDPHEKGAKLDAGKVRTSLVLGGFSRALLEVGKVGTYGAKKYTDNGWMEVPNGGERYTDALMRHLLSDFAGEERDQDTELLHAAHAAWNALARLELKLREARVREESASFSLSLAHARVEHST